MSTSDCFLQRAIEEGTDFIETDILSSKDGVLICHHDVILDNTTDIAKHKEFENRRKTYEVQGVNMTGFFVGMKAFYSQLPLPYLSCGTRHDYVMLLGTKTCFNV